MNKLLRSEEIAESIVRQKIQQLSDNICEKEEYDIANGLKEVYSRLPLYYQDEFIIKKLNSKLDTYEKRLLAEEEQKIKAGKKLEKKPFWQRAVGKVMGKLGYGTKEESYSHKKVEEGTVFG